MTKALSELAGPVRALFTDLDGTLTSDGRLEPTTMRALEELFASRIPVVLVTGRPAGWGHCLASLFPFAAAVTENGGLSFVPTATGFRKVFGVEEPELPGWRSKMRVSASAAMRDKVGAKYSADSAYREVDLAIDWNEDVCLPSAEADSIVAHLKSDGLSASRSSVHVNFGPPCFDKFSACKQIIAELFGEEGEDLDSYVFIGDSLNDAPMFAGFPKSVGVANVKERWSDLPHKPKYLTDASEGAGFCELVRHILAL